MPSINLLSSHLDIIPRIALASDADRTSPTLSGVLIRILPNADVIVAATDGKILAEWRGNLGGVCSTFPIDPVDLILPWRVNKDIATWFKASMASAKRDKPGKEWTLAWDDAKRNVTLSFMGSILTTKTVEGVYPNYAPALDRESQSPARVGFNGHNLALINDILHDGDKHQCAVQARQGRGWIFEPVNGSQVGYRALVMPITLPDVDASQVVDVNKARLAELEAHEAAVKAGSVSTSTDPALEAECKRLRDLLSKREAEIVELKERTTLAEAQAPAPLRSPLIKWTPSHQGKQLAKAELTVKDLKEAGFKWVISQWVGETVMAEKLLERIKKANGLD